MYEKIARLQDEEEKILAFSLEIKEVIRNRQAVTVSDALMESLLRYQIV